MPYPERGPAILFFTGGTALRALSHKLKQLTTRSIHLLSPFDSGGSSASLRDAFNILSVGDIRNRMTALVDTTTAGNYFARLLDDRFAKFAAKGALRERLNRLATGQTSLVASLSQPLANIVQANLSTLAEELPRSFNLSGASVGNLVLVGGYLRNNFNISKTIDELSVSAKLRGIVGPIADSNAHLAVKLSDGRSVIGQHRITGGAGTITSPIKEISAIKSLANPTPTDVPALGVALQWIRQADLICYPMGSFWTSVAAQLLPVGVGRAIAESQARKVYIPSTGHDREQIGMSLSAAIESLVELGRRDDSAHLPITSLVTDVLINTHRKHYALRLDTTVVAHSGIRIIETDLTSTGDRPILDPTQLANKLVELAC